MGPIAADRDHIEVEFVHKALDYAQPTQESVAHARTPIMTEPVRALDVVDYQLGISDPSLPPAVAFRLYLRDGSSQVFVLPAEAAARLLLQLDRELKLLADRPPPASH